VLYYAWYQGIFSAGCTNPTDPGWSCIVIDSNGGKYSSYNFQDASPNDEEIAYYDPVSGMLKYAIYMGNGDPDANCGWDEDDSEYVWRCEEMVDMGASLLVADVALTLDGDGYPLIAYTDASEDLAPSALNIRPRRQSARLLQLRPTRPEFVHGLVCGWIMAAPTPQRRITFLLPPGQAAW
jgi:hypothetical protein